jgi:uncharacterized protein DUF3987
VIEGTRHHANLFVLQVGQSSKARKGTAIGRIKQLLEHVDEEWKNKRIKGALSSGEGLIWLVRDPIYKMKNGVQEVADQGETDKRLMVVASEFASLLNVMGREGNILSTTIRDAFDGLNLDIPTKNSPAKATAPHISIIGHITQAELLRYLHETEMGSGFANRFLFACVRRAKNRLPFGGSLSDEAVAEMDMAVKAVVKNVASFGEIPFSIDGGKLWEQVYPKLQTNGLDCSGR